MPFPRGILIAVLALCCVLGAAARVEAVTCGANATANPILFGCSPLSQACTITGANAPAGCKLDFGNRKVIFSGTFDVSDPVLKASSLVVTAAQIEVRGALKARSDNNKAGGTIELNAADSIVVSGTVDVSGNSAGLLRMRAGGLVEITSTGSLRARGLESNSTGNSASGGTIDIVAGSSFALRSALDVSGGPFGAGGSLLVQAGTTLLISQTIDATGGEGDGGDVDLTSGDDLTIERSIDASSPANGGGGGITARAGVDRAGGVKVGGTLTVTAPLTSNGDNDSLGGYDGGEIALRAFGPVLVSGALTAVGGFPDGGGGMVSVDSSDNAPFRVTALDGDLNLSSVIDVHGSSVGSGDDTASGGDVDIFVGRDGTVTGTMDLSGSDGGGDLTAFVGHALNFGAIVNASGTIVDASGGSVTLETGRSASGPLSVTKTLDVSAPNGTQGSVSLKGCGLTLAQGLVVNAKTSRPNAQPKIDLVSSSALSIGSGGNYLANPLGRVAVVHPAGTPPQIGSNVTFAPTMVDSTDLVTFPICAVCGDGIRQIGETCDRGAGADGACCNADCSAFVCQTVTPTPTVTATSTAPTRTATPVRTRTPTPTRTAIATFTVAPTGPTDVPTPTPPPTVGPIATPILPFIEPRTVLDCEKILGKSGSALAIATLKTLETCAIDAFKCVNTKNAGNERNGCLVTTGRRCDAKLTQLDTLRTRFQTQFIANCGGEPPAVPIELLRSVDVLGFAKLEPQCFLLDLTSPDAILGCLQVVSPCEVAHALGVGIPRVGDLLALVTTKAGDEGPCLPASTGSSGGLAGLPIAAQTVRCQRAIASNGQKLLTRQMSVARGCVDSLLKCRLSGKPREICQKTALACSRKLGALDDPTVGARAKMLAAIHGACSALPTDVLREATGIGYAAADQRCAALGAEPATDAATVGICATRAYVCAGSAVLRQILPSIDAELARFGLELGNDAFCALPTPTATATPIPTSTRTATPIPTGTPTLSATPTVTTTGLGTTTATTTPSSTPAATSTGPTSTPPPTETPTPGEPATPTPSPTPGCPSGILDAGEQCDLGDDVAGDGCDPLCRFELLVPGGGTKSSDCIAEWAVINPFNTPALGTDDLPSTQQSCVDGDPSCDADGAFDDRCVFRVALCLQNQDPNLPTCTAPPGIAKYVLVSPRPNSSDAGDAANALALVDAFGHLSPVQASGNSSNTLVFDPPMVLAAPDNCTETALLVVERRGLRERSEKFRIGTWSVPPIDGTKSIEDDDTLLLSCLDAPDPTPTPTETPTPAVTATP